MKTEHKWTLIIMYQIMILVMLILDTEVHIAVNALVIFQSVILIWQVYEANKMSKISFDYIARQDFLIEEQRKTIKALRSELEWPTKNI